MVVYTAKSRLMSKQVSPLPLAEQISRLRVPVPAVPSLRDKSRRVVEPVAQTTRRVVRQRRVVPLR